MRHHSIRSLVLALLLVAAPAAAAGLQGDPAAIAEAEAMVEAMGGRAVWAETEVVHFVHRWYPHDSPRSYLEHETLDLTGPRSWVEMEDDSTHRVRAYSPEYGYWERINGVFTQAPEERLARALERAPFSIYRIARNVARGEADFSIHFGEGDIPQSRRLEFRDAEGEVRGWIILNANREPLVWATTQYRYTFGPMKSFGPLRHPNWAVYGNGYTRYDMISLEGGAESPPLSLFAPPPDR